MSDLEGVLVRLLPVLEGERDGGLQVRVIGTVGLAVTA